jgi:hypothetical protein
MRPTRLPAVGRHYRRPSLWRRLIDALSPVPAVTTCHHSIGTLSIEHTVSPLLSCADVEAAVLRITGNPRG